MSWLCRGTSDCSIIHHGLLGWVVLRFASCSVCMVYASRNCLDTTIHLWTSTRPVLLGDNRSILLAPHNAHYNMVSVPRCHCTLIRWIRWCMLCYARDICAPPLTCACFLRPHLAFALPCNCHVTALLPALMPLGSRQLREDLVLAGLARLGSESGKVCVSKPVDSVRITLLS